jgi:S-adenosylmethionine hydrolase
MALVTFTTDLSSGNYYLAAIKGAILTKSPDARFVDIENNIKAFDVKQGAYIIGNAFSFFPEKSIHVIHVGLEYAWRRRILIAEHRNHYFLAADNGLLPLIFFQQSAKIYSINSELVIGDNLFKSSTISTVVKHLADGNAMEEIAQPASDYYVIQFPNPSYANGSIRGHVMHIDHYGNIVTNVSKELFYRIIKTDLFTIQARNFISEKISETYRDVDHVEPLTLFNSAGFLELALNRAKANKLFGIDYDTNILIDERNDLH